jgi:hypothetical protein
METPKEYHYTYYSYEEWGRGYFGSRTCKCLPEEDKKYFGSFKDKTFKPTQKIILKSDYATREEAYADEILLHDYFEVDINPHFANRSRQTSTKFRCPAEVFRTKEFREKASSRTKGEKNPMYGRKRPDWVEIMKNVPKDVRRNAGIKGGKVSGNENKRLGRGICGLTPEERSKNSKKNYENGVGIASLTFEEKSQAGKKGSAKNKENKVGIFSMTKEELSLAGKKSYEIRASKGQDLFSTMSIEERRMNAKITNSQKWMCLETGYITNSGALTHYQKARGIDTSKRVRIE